MTPPAEALPARPTEIAEFQGLYGSYHISELLLQKLWLRGDFDARRLATLEGEELRILHPGKWNRLGGPDFLRARIALGDREVTGDVEVHFRAEAWRQHGHDTDPAYENVILHVVLFPPAGGQPLVETCRGRKVPLLVLVDRLWHDLEEYAADDAVAALNGVDPLPVVEKLLGLDSQSRAAALQAAAGRRWQEKVYFAGLRIERLGWNEACHQTALEILGYRNNRPAMLRVGSVFPHAAWRKSAPSLDELLGAAASYWHAQGARPANHPRQRLLQYQAWMRRIRDWPDTLRELELPPLPQTVIAADVATVRRFAGLVSLRGDLGRVLCGGAVGGTRWDTLMGNLVLPFLAVVHRQSENRPALERFWEVWYPGDIPDSMRKAVRDLGEGGHRAPSSNGLVQGLLDLQLARRPSR